MFGRNLLFLPKDTKGRREGKREGERRKDGGRDRDGKKEGGRGNERWRRVESVR